MPGKKKLLCLFAAIRPVNRIKIKGMVRAKGGIQSQQWYPYSKVQALRKKCRTQSLWNLHLAGAVSGGSAYPRAKERASSIAVDIAHVCVRVFVVTKTQLAPPPPPFVRRLAPCHGKQVFEWLTSTSYARDAHSKRCRRSKICKRSFPKASELGFASAEGMAVPTYGNKFSPQ